MTTDLSLVDNYRSRGGIIDFVNEVGVRFWDDGDIAYEQLAAKFDYEPHGADPRVDVWFIDQPEIEDEDGKEKREPVEETREREGVAIAAWIRDAVDGPKPLIVYDRETESYRAGALRRHCDSVEHAQPVSGVRAWARGSRDPVREGWRTRVLQRARGPGHSRRAQGHRQSTG